MNSNTFDGNAAFSGGGFMPSQATQSAEPAHLHSRNREMGLAPLTVKQINEALSGSSESSYFVVDGVEVNNVTVVGMVVNKVERVSDVGFVLDDGTGRINVQRWINEAIDSKEVENIIEGMYIRVFAHLKGFQGKRQLVAFAFRPVVDYNEITCHFMECMYVHAYNIKLQKGGGSHRVDAPVNNGTPYRGQQQSMPQSQFPGQSNVTAGMEGMEQMILNCLQQHSNIEKGLHRDNIARKLNTPLPKIVESLKILEEEGLVYCTIDDFHFKTAADG